MNLPETCPFCGSGVAIANDGKARMSERCVEFGCGTNIHRVADARRFQSLECEVRERVRLAARVAELEARCKRLEEAGDALQSAVVGTEGMNHWQWLAAAHEADLKWRSAKEAKP